MTCPLPQPLSITLPNGTNAERFGVVSNSTPEDCLPFDLTRHTVSTKATNAAGTFVVEFETEVLTPANKGQFKVHFNLGDEEIRLEEGDVTNVRAGGNEVLAASVVKIEGEGAERMLVVELEDPSGGALLDKEAKSFFVARGYAEEAFRIPSSA